MGLLNACCGDRPDMAKGQVNIEKLVKNPHEMIREQDIVEKHIIKGTAYQLIKTKKQKYGMVRKIENHNEPFDFETHKHQYDTIGDFIQKYIQREMMDMYGLKEIWVPEDEHIEEEYWNLPKCNVFMSPQIHKPAPAMNKGRKALVLIQGSGGIRAGMWARSACIYKDLETGSMLPVLVMNPNFNHDAETGQAIPYSSDMSEHARWVWEYIRESGFDNVDIVAHSAGGGCLRDIMWTYDDSLWDQVKQIAYTDSWVVNKYALSERGLEFMQTNAVHYRASELPKGEKIEDKFPWIHDSACPAVSAGHISHEYSTGAAMDLIFKQFNYN